MWVEYFRGGQKSEDAAAYIEESREIYISAITIAEVYRFLLQHEQKLLAERLTHWMILRSIVVPVTKDIALKAALLKQEHKFGLGDALIYATALIQQVSLISGDADFKGKTGVTYLGE